MAGHSRSAAGQSRIASSLYRMLAYIYPPLEGGVYARQAEAGLLSPADMLAALLAAGVSTQLKHGLHRQYADQREQLSAVRGRIDMPATMALGSRRSNHVFCEYDALTEDNPANQNIKAAITQLLANPYVQPTQHRRLKRLLPYFAAVGNSAGSPRAFARLGATQAMLLGLSGLVLDCLRGASLTADGMDRVCSGFVLGYYRRQHPEWHPQSRRTRWDADHTDMLPAMQGIELSRAGTKLMVDVRFYRREVLRARGGLSAMHGDNIHRLYSRVKNAGGHKPEGRETPEGHETPEGCGLLLYFREDGQALPAAEYIMGGSRVVVRCIDLAQPFGRVVRNMDSFITRQNGGVLSSVVRNGMR